MAVPRRDVLLAPYSSNFKDRVVATPATWQLTAGQASALSAVQVPYLEAYDAMVAAREAGNRSQNLTAVKDAAKDALLPILRNLYAFIATNETIPDSDKILLGITPRKTATPRPVPSEIPAMKISKRWGTTVEVTLDNDLGNASKPGGSQGAIVYSFVGENFPENIALWTNEGLTTRMKAEVVFDSALPAGTKVWITAAYMNFRGQVGDGCSPISAVLAGGTMNVKGSGSLTETENTLKAA